MTSHVKKTNYQLTGDWTIFGVIDQFDTLSHWLQDLAFDQNKIHRIDCEKITNVDISGLQLLHVWMECAKMRGVKIQLFNLPDNMRKSFRRMGLEYCTMDND